MAIVTEYDWTSDTFTSHSDRHAFRAAVAEIAARAHAKLAESTGRIDSAVKLVLAGDVELLTDGTAKVASQSNGTTTYRVVNGHCDCRDYTFAPGHFCKHRLAYGIARRAQELTATQPVVAPSTQPLPEAPASANCFLMIGGRQVQLTLRGHDEREVLARMEACIARYPATPQR